MSTKLLAKILAVCAIIILATSIYSTANVVLLTEYKPLISPTMGVIETAEERRTDAIAIQTIRLFSSLIVSVIMILFSRLCYRWGY